MRENNIKANLREIGRDGMEWIPLAQDSYVWLGLVNMIMTFWFHKIFKTS
jgi:hypothetical protein